MTVVAGLKEIGLFRYLGSSLLAGLKSTRQLALTLTALCFFLQHADHERCLADHLCAVFRPDLKHGRTPGTSDPCDRPADDRRQPRKYGNSDRKPQNLYLYSTFGLSAGTLIRYMLPLTVFSALLLVIAVFLLRTGRFPSTALPWDETILPERSSLIFYLALFLVCLGCVVRIYSWHVMFLVVLAAVLVKDRTLFFPGRLFSASDLRLLLVFIGNMERIPAVSSLLTRLISGVNLRPASS